MFWRGSRIDRELLLVLVSILPHTTSSIEGKQLGGRGEVPSSNSRFSLSVGRLKKVPFRIAINPYKQKLKKP